MGTLLTIAGVPVNQNFIGGQELVSWTAGMMIDADGCPIAYHPIERKGLEAHSSGGYPNGGWRNILAAKTKTSPAYIQREGIDPNPGFFVSMSSYHHKNKDGSRKNDWDTTKHVDANLVPYCVVPPQVRKKALGIVLGCYVKMSYKNKEIIGVVADIGPKNKIGEASICAARLLGIPSNPRRGGIESKLVNYTIYPGKTVEIDGVKYELQPVGS